jgi:hypothetical protein
MSSGRKVCLVLAHEFLVDLLVAHKLTNIGKKSEQIWPKSHWHAK